MIDTEELTRMKLSDVFREMDKANVKKMTVKDGKYNIKLNSGEKTGYMVISDNERKNLPGVKFNFNRPRNKKEINWSEYDMDKIGEINWNNYGIDRIE